jgi:pimeloyl-ACP methyl ester carboxylesterase
VRIRSARRSRLASAAGLLAAALAACSGSGSPTAVPATATPAATDSTFVADVPMGDGRSLHIVCLGPTNPGKPTVILEHGLGADYGTWEMVLTGLEPTQRTCAYDRSGRSRLSSLPTGTRTTADQVEDLHKLLVGAGIKPPYVLVGHSIGGWNVLVYTQRYPAEVVGAVFVDVRPPEASKRWLAALPPKSPTDSQALIDNRFDLTVFEADPTRNVEELDLVASAAEANAAPGFGDRPFVVLVPADTSEAWAGLDPALVATLEKIDTELLQGLVSLSSQGRLVKVANTGHAIQEDQPPAVVEAILDVLAKTGP